MRNFKLYCLLLFAMMAAGQAYAQTMVSGVVKSPQGDALVGTNVLIRGTNVGTVTDVEGKFNLQIPAGMNDSSLVVTSIGYASKIVAIKGQTSFTIVLSEDTEQLDEVVVTGYQSQLKENITGSVGIVSSELLTKIPAAGIDQLLQGRVAGVLVTQNTGAPGEGVRVRIRGIGSINSNNSPLYIIDGLPTLDATNIAPGDIDKLSVLKDASEAAIYGSRAANGVVIITTKLGSTTKPTIQYSTQFGVQTPSRLVPMANTSQYIQLYNEAITNDGVPQNLKIADDPSTLPNVNWAKEITRKNALLQTHNLTFSGGEGKTRYLVAGSYFKQDGIIKASDYQRINARINVDSQIKDWLRVGVNTNLSTATTDLIGSSGDGAGGNGGSVLRYAYFRPSAVPVYTATGAFVDKPGDYYTSNPSKYQTYFGDGYNPAGMLAYNNNKRSVDRLFGKAFFILTPLKGLKFTSNTGIDYSSITQRRFDRNWGTENSPGHGRINDPNTLSVLNQRIRNLTFTNFAEYETSTGLNNFKFLLGTEAIKNTTYTQSSSDKGFIDQTNDVVYVGNGLLTKSLSENRVGNALLSFYGKVNYDFDSRYILSGTLRRDGSSRFGANNRWGTFYAFSGGWRIDKENFLVDSNWINRLLLRAGYGVIGNQEIGNYPNQSVLSSNFAYPFGGIRNTGYGIQQYGNRDVKWESSSQLNIGVDLDVLDGKLKVSVDYFDKITSDLLVRQPYPASLGYVASDLLNGGPPYINNGKIQNRGVELGIEYKNTIGDFSYTIAPNVSFLQNKVVSMAVPLPDGKRGGDNITLTQEGHPVGSFYLIQQAGIFQSEGDIFTSAKPPGSFTPKVGDVKYVDANNDLTIDDKDKVFAGSAIPKVNGGLNMQASYKSWDISAFFQGAYGQKIFSTLNVDIEGFYRAFNVTERYFNDHWTATNPSNQFPRASFASGSYNTRVSTRFLEDGSYTRLKNLQVGYTVPKAFLQKYGLASLRIYFSGTNLLTFTKYSGMDPEMTASDNANGSADRANGIDWGTYPAAKSYNVGLNVTF